MPIPQSDPQDNEYIPLNYSKINSNEDVNFAKAVDGTTNGPDFIDEDNTVNYNVLVNEWDLKMSTRFKTRGDGINPWGSRVILP